MTLAKTREKLLDSDDFVLQETSKLQVFFRLKETIRFHESRGDAIHAESVAEHIFGVSVLARYFLPLEDTEQKLHMGKIYDMILIHDLEEVEAGDVIGYLKTEEDRRREREAAQRVLNALPEAMQEHIRSLFEEYEKRESAESRFVKALDVIEPLFQLYNERGKKLMHKNGTTYDQHRSIKEKYIETYPYVSRFNSVISETMSKEGFFTKPA